MRDLAYIKLMSSLPRPEALFLAKRPPVSRARLNERLKELSPEDRKTLTDLCAFLDWGGLPGEGDTAAYVRAAKRFLARLAYPTLARVLSRRLELRTVVAALRLRLAGVPAPTTSQSWGFGRWAGYITAHWTTPDFGLGHLYPWIDDVRTALEAGEADIAEHHLLEACLKDLSRASRAHTFDFEAVALYVLKWRLLDRSTSADGLAASNAFDALTSEALAAWDNTRQTHTGLEAHHG